MRKAKTKMLKTMSARAGVALGRTSRRRLLQTAAGLAVVAVTGAPRILRAAGSLQVLNWQGYGTDEAWALAHFEKATGIKVVHDYFNSEPEMITKLRTNPGAYDVVLTNCAWNGVASDEGLVEPIDTAAIKYYGDLDPLFRDSPLLVKEGKTYGLAWVWGMTAIAYSTDVFKQAPDTIEALWDARNEKRVALRDDGIEAVSFAAIATGQDMNHPKDLEKIKAKLLSLKPNIAALWSSEDEWNKLFSAKTFDLSAYWSGSAARSKTNYHLPVGYTVPKEGAIGWFDGLAIAAHAPNRAAAHQFINYMVDPDFYYEWATKVGAPASANNKANAKLPADDMGRQIHSNGSFKKRLQYMAPLSDAERQAYADLWTEVKTEYAKT